MSLDIERLKISGFRHFFGRGSECQRTLILLGLSADIFDKTYAEIMPKLSRDFPEINNFGTISAKSRHDFGVKKKGEFYAKEKSKDKM